MLKGIAFALIAAGLWLLINVGNLRSFLEAYQGRNQELEQVELAKKRIERLRRQQISLQNNGFEAERHARLDLGMQLPGERVIVLKPEGADKANGSDVKSGTAKSAAENRERGTAHKVELSGKEKSGEVAKAVNRDDSDAPAPAPKTESASRARPPREAADSGPGTDRQEKVSTMKKSAVAQ